MKKAMKHTTNYEIEQWVEAPTWKVIVWFVMIMVVIAVLWVVNKLER